MKKDQADAGAGAGSTVSAVSALMEERRRFESWIAALDQKRASTPDHVFTRVSADYQRRLEAVVAKLSTHADGLREEIGALSRRLETVRQEHQQAADERAEAELRAHVGELSAEHWETLAAASDTKMGELAGQASDMEQELARTRDLLTDTERPTPAPAAPVVPQPEPEPEPVALASVSALEFVAAPAPPTAEEAARAELSSQAPPLQVSDVAEGAAHVPVAEVPTAAASDASSAPSSPPPRASAPIAQPRSSGGFDELSFLRSVVDSPAGPVESAPRDEPDEAAKLDSFARRSREESVQSITGEQPLIMRSSGEELARDSQQLAYQRTPGSALDPIKDSPADGAKTLKCGECGALNYPTEWYCERCGAELASL